MGKMPLWWAPSPSELSGEGGKEDDEVEDQVEEKEKEGGGETKERSLVIYGMSQDRCLPAPFVNLCSDGRCGIRWAAGVVDARENEKSEGFEIGGRR